MTMPVEPPAQTVQGSASEPETVERPEPPTTLPEPVEGPANQTTFPEPVEGPATASAFGPAWAPQQAPAAKVTERAHPLTPFVRGWIVILALAFGLGRELLQNQSEAAQLPPLEFLASGIGIALLGAVAVGYVSWRFTHFVIDADELRVDTGAVFKRSVRVAFDKVQAIDVVQPFAARLIGLAELQIDVGSQERVRLRYLKLTRAYALRDYLLARARGHQVAAQEHAQAASVLTDLNAQDEVLVKVPPQTLLLAAVTSHEFFSIVGGGIVTAAIVVSSLRLGYCGRAAEKVIFVHYAVTGQFNPRSRRSTVAFARPHQLTSHPAAAAHPGCATHLSPIWRWLGFYCLDIADRLGQRHQRRERNRLRPFAAGRHHRAGQGGAARDLAAHRLRGYRVTPPAARWLHLFAAPLMRCDDDQLTVTGTAGRAHLDPSRTRDAVCAHSGPIGTPAAPGRVGVPHRGGTIPAPRSDADSVRARKPSRCSASTTCPRSTQRTGCAARSCYRLVRLAHPWPASTTGVTELLRRTRRFRADRRSNHSSTEQLIRRPDGGAAAPAATIRAGSPDASAIRRSVDAGHARHRVHDPDAEPVPLPRLAADAVRVRFERALRRHGVRVADVDVVARRCHRRSGKSSLLTRGVRPASNTDHKGNRLCGPCQTSSQAEPTTLK